MDYSDIDMVGGDAGAEVSEAESEDTDFGDGDGVNEFDDIYNEMDSGYEPLEYFGESEATGVSGSDGHKSGETTESDVDDELADFDDSATSDGLENVWADTREDGTRNQSDMTTEECVEDALADFDDDMDITYDDTQGEPAAEEDCSGPEDNGDAANGNNDGTARGNVNGMQEIDRSAIDEHDEGTDAEKTAIFENVSYHQGQNEIGALGTCGPTSIANSLNRVTGTADYTENAVLHNAMDNNLCHKSDNPYFCGGTTTKDVVSIIDNVKSPESNIHTEVYEYEKALSTDDLASRLDDSGTVAMIGVDSATLWDQRGDVASSGLFQHTDAPSDHWITVDSPIRDEAGNVIGFHVIDSGGGVSEVSREKFESMYMGDESHSVSDPTAVLISNSNSEVDSVSTSEETMQASNYKGSAMESDGGDPPDEVSLYETFKGLSTEDQIETFSDMSSEKIYDMVKNSSESWPVDGYDRITPKNAKDFIVLNVNDRGETSFNLDWPKYGGYNPETISSISDLSGKVEVSRDGGDGGYTMGIGRNEDGTYDNNSMRSIPKFSAEVNTGTFDIDKYKEAVDIVSGSASDDEKTSLLMDMGFDEDSADNMLRDYENWKSRPEIIGDGNIGQGAKMANPDRQIDMKYGVHGRAAEWDIGGVHMEGGAGQMNTVFSWGTCREAGIITNCSKAKIN